MTAQSNHKSFITTTSGFSGHFAVKMWWNPDYGGFWEPWETGDGRYGTKEDAELEGRQWVEREGIEFHPKNQKHGLRSFPPLPSIN